MATILAPHSSPNMSQNSRKLTQACHSDMIRSLIKQGFLEEHGKPKSWNSLANDIKAKGTGMPNRETLQKIVEKGTASENVLRRFLSVVFGNGFVLKESHLETVASPSRPKRDNTSAPEATQEQVNIYAPFDGALVRPRFNGEVACRQLFKVAKKEIIFCGISHYRDIIFERNFIPTSLNGRTLRILTHYPKLENQEYVGDGRLSDKYKSCNDKDREVIKYVCEYLDGRTPDQHFDEFDSNLHDLTVLLNDLDDLKKRNLQDKNSEILVNFLPYPPRLKLFIADPEEETGETFVVPSFNTNWSTVLPVFHLLNNRSTSCLTYYEEFEKLWDRGEPILDTEHRRRLAEQ